MRRFKVFENGYRYDRWLLWALLLPGIALFIIASVDALTSEYTFYAEIECMGYECDNPFYGDCPHYLERQMPSLCEQETISPGTYGEKPEVSPNWLYFSLMGAFILFFSINHLWHNGDNQWKSK